MYIQVQKLDMVPYDKCVKASLVSIHVFLVRLRICLIDVLWDKKRKCAGEDYSRDEVVAYTCMRTFWNIEPFVRRLEMLKFGYFLLVGMVGGGN